MADGLRLLFSADFGLAVSVILPLEGSIALSGKVLSGVQSLDMKGVFGQFFLKGSPKVQYHL